MANAINIATGHDNFANATEAISKEALGAEFLGWESFHGFSVRHEVLGFSHLRWPGGIPTEDGIDVTGDGVRDAVFDLTSENIMTWNRWADEADKADGVPTGVPREGLREMLAFVDQNDMSFAMIVPTARYVGESLETGDRAGALDHARADIRQFVERLVAGEFGPVPESFTLEIGSEYYATDVWMNNNADPYDNRDGTRATSDADLVRMFGEVFAVISSEIKDTLNELTALGMNPDGIDLKVAVQLGRFQSAPDVDIRDGQNSDNDIFLQAFRDHGALDAIDSVIWHRFTPEFHQISQGLYEDIHGTNLTKVVAGWEQATGRPLDLVGGWLSPSAELPADNEFGAPGLTNILQLFTGLAAAGMDTGSIFGIGFEQAGTLGKGPTTFIGGQLFGMMVESLPGMYVLNRFQNNTPAAIGETLVQDGTVNSFAFEDDDKIVVFAVAKDFSGEVLEFKLNISGIFESAEIKRLFDPDGIDIIDDDNIGVVGEIQHEIEIKFDESNGYTTFDLNFNTGFEVIRLTAFKSVTGTTSPIVAVPKQLDSSIPGLTFTGTKAADTLIGGSGNDRIDGGKGSDRLDGQGGDDILTGGKGRDVFVFSAGNDRITDFETKKDKIEFAPALWGGGALPSGVLAFAEERAGRVVFDFGEDNSLTLENIGSLSVLRESMFVLASSPSPASPEPAPGSSGETLNVITGTKAADTLIGGSGNDRIDGGKGSDRLDGQGGDDILTGGKGRDVFLFSAGNDRITDFETKKDKIEFDPALWGDGDPPGGVLAFAGVQAGSVVFDFGEDNSLTLENISSLASLSESMFLI